MASALAVAEGTRRSNMSRLRSWLGEDPTTGEPYLPDAYTGRIVLHPRSARTGSGCRSSPAGGVNRASDDGLRAALELVRGAPLADAAPGQWHWAEELRTDMISCVRDIGAELADRALAAATSIWPGGRRRGPWSPRRVTSCCWWPGSAPSTGPATPPRPSG